MTARTTAGESLLSQGLRRYLPEQALRALAASHVGIAGCGGLGSNVAIMLARSGVGSFTLVDMDHVEASNLNRQAYYPEDVGQAKVVALSRHLRRLNPALIVHMHEVRVTAASAGPLFADCPILVEAFDGAEDKAMLYQALAPVKSFMVFASGLAGWSGPAMELRRLSARAVMVGDFVSAVSDTLPPLAPRVHQAAALQAGQVLEHIMGPLV